MSTRNIICDRCLHYFSSCERLQLHAVDCQRMNDCAITLPAKDDKWLNFRNINHKECPLSRTSSVCCERRNTIQSKRHTYINNIYLASDITYDARMTSRYPCTSFVAIKIASRGSPNNLKN
ncbi:uncharacterized protein LOC118645175 [Monomorium pharaonis]|uniref:uncharacterized protein LOC118645175 n=1 Tax=Monomorium pharaonis TaxID=307658 RepID=UPI001746CA83|nr:uncharacterized protein LOC118645175 [Monomorium pharaonis]